MREPLFLVCHNAVAMATLKLTALVMAGGRFEIADAQAAATTIKALTRIGAPTMLSGVLSALAGAEHVGRVLVVGPDDVRVAACDAGAEWTPESDSLLGNVRAGIRAAELTGQTRVLLVGSDLAVPRSQSIDDFISRVPTEAAFAAPVVPRATYENAYPGGVNRFLALKEGEFTMGSQIVLPAGLVLEPPPVISSILGSRKSQWRMARILGFGFLLRLLTRSLTIPMVERRASDMLGVPARAVTNCAPDLAFDVDDAQDLAYARGLIETKTGHR